MSAAVAEKHDTPIGGVPALHIMAVWDKVEPILARVVKPVTGDTLDSVLTDLQLKNLQLWVIGDFQGVAVTALQVRPLHKVLWVKYLAGDHMKEWLADLGGILDEYARHNGCAAIEFAGRNGWNKLREAFPDFKSVTTTFRRELE